MSALSNSSGIYFNSHHDSKINHAEYKRAIFEIDDPSVTHFPGILELIRAPRVIVQTVPKLFKASLRLDLEESLDIILRINRANLSFFHAANSAISFVPAVSHSILTHHSLWHLHKILIPILGFILVFIEGVSEIIALLRIFAFKRSLAHNGDAKSIAKAIHFLHSKYFLLTPHKIKKVRHYVQLKYPELKGQMLQKKMGEISQRMLQIKKCNLARRVRPWLALEIEGKMPRILKNLNSSLPGYQQKGIQEAKVILADIEKQIYKKRLLHTMGLITLGLAVLSMTLTLLGIPLPFLVVIFAVSFGCSQLRQHYCNSMDINPYITHALVQNKLSIDSSSKRAQHKSRLNAFSQGIEGFAQQF